MGLIGLLKTIFVGTEKQYVTQRMPQIITGKKFELSKAEKISTVFTCIDVLGKTLAKLPLEKYLNTTGGKIKDKENYLYELLHYNPNAYTTSFNFIYACETIRNFTGNVLAYIDRENAGGKVKSLEIIKPGVVVDYVVKDGSLFYIMQPDPEVDDFETVPAMNVLHFRMMSKDGIWGMNPIQALRANLSTTAKGMETIDNFYDNNANAPKALKSTVSGANQKAMQEALDKFKKEYAGAENSGKMIPLPPNTEIQELKLNFADAQFIETVKFNANQIAALFGIPPHMVGNTETSKYNNVEQMMIGFKADTISPIARMYRQELEYKLLTTKQRASDESIEFNLNAMIETDHKTRLEGYKILTQIGAMSPNKVAQIENLPIDENGDVRMVPMNMMTLKKMQQNETKVNNIKN